MNLKVIRDGRPADSTLPAEELAAINAYAKTALTPEEVYTFSLILCDNEVDRDGERFTLRTLEELRGGACGPAGRDCLAYIDVLIDGPYLQERNRPDCVLRGSENQIIHYLNPGLAGRYKAYLAQGRMLESFSHNRDVVLTGIWNRRDRD